MARTAYWVIDLASYTAPTNSEIRQGQRTGGVAALVSGSESFAATSGSGTITEATTVTTLSAGTQYRLSWTIYDDVAADYATTVHALFDSLSTGTADLAGSFAVAATSTADLSGSFAIAATGTADLSGSFEIEATAGVGAADLSCSFAIAAAAIADLTPAFAIATTDTADLSPSFAISATAWADLTATFALAATALSDLPASFQIAGSGTADLACSFAIEGVAGPAVWPDPATVLAGVTYGPTGADYTGTLALLTAAQVWAYVSRTLTGTVPANVKQVNDVTIAGSGVPGSDPWRPAP